jgi:hypothetical protein
MGYRKDFFLKEEGRMNCQACLNKNKECQSCVLKIFVSALVRYIGAECALKIISLSYITKFVNIFLFYGAKTFWIEFNKE